MDKIERILLLSALIGSLSLPFSQAFETADAAAPAVELDLTTYKTISNWLLEVGQQQLSVDVLRERLEPHIPALFKCLESPMALQRSLAVRALAFARDRHRAAQAIANNLAKDEDAAVRAQAAFSLGLLNDAGSADALIAALRDEDANVRESAILALGRMQDERAGKALLERLRYDHSNSVRMAAARTLAQLPADDLKDELIAILEIERDERVRWMLAQTLKEMNREDGAAAEDDGVPSPDAFSSKLKALASDMKSVENNLRSDRHDSGVQNDQQDVEIKLAEMIRSIENMERAQSMASSSSKDSKKRWALSSSSQSSPGGAGAGGSGGKDSKPSGENAFQAARVADQKDRWAQLPPAARDEMLQIFRPEVPARWRKRLEAYFLSVAAEEAKQQK
jgi:hypothetical protein